MISSLSVGGAGAVTACGCVVSLKSIVGAGGPTGRGCIESSSMRVRSSSSIDSRRRMTPEPSATGGGPCSSGACRLRGRRCRRRRLERCLVDRGLVRERHFGRSLFRRGGVRGRFDRGDVRGAVDGRSVPGSSVLSMFDLARSSPEVASASPCFMRSTRRQASAASRGSASSISHMRATLRASSARALMSFPRRIWSSKTRTMPAVVA